MSLPIPVIVADDHPLIRAALVAVLKDTPDIKVVAEASNADEALEVAIKQKPRVAILDISMPGVDVFQAAAQIKSLSGKTELLILSGNSHDRLIDSAIRVGAKGFVAKSDDPREVIDAVRAIAHGREYFSGKVKDRVVEAGRGKEAAGSRGAKLSDRELEVLRYVARGMAKKQIAELMCLSVKTVDKHVTSVMEKLDIHDRVELARYAIREGIVEA